MMKMLKKAGSALKNALTGIVPTGNSEEEEDSELKFQPE